MGIDARIYFKTRTGEYPDLSDMLPIGANILLWSDFYNSTHTVDQTWRYYGPNYERGPWPKIAATLLVLMESRDVETVWYLGDHDDSDRPFTPDRLEKFNKHYIEHGHRPYRGIFNNKLT